MPRIGKGLYRQKSQTERKCQRCGTTINKGDLYILYEPRYGGSRIRCNSPQCMLRPSEMTSSSYLSPLWSAQESITDAVQSSDASDILQAIEDAVSTAEEVGGEAQDSLDNMPEALQESSASGETLQSYIDACETWQTELESAKDTVEQLVSEIEELETEKANLEAENEVAEEADDEYEERTTRIEEIAEEIENKTGEASEAAEEASGSLEL